MNLLTETFLTTFCTIVDIWYQASAPQLLAGKAGKKPGFSDSEVISLSLAQHWMQIADEREGAQSLLDNCRRLTVLGDKSFLDRSRQAILEDRLEEDQLEEDQGLHLLTPKRKNQSEQNAPGWDALMNRTRRVIETTFA